MQKNFLLLLGRQFAPDGSSTFLAPAYDANGNITAYFDLDTGKIAQSFEYDAFGRSVTVDAELAGSQGKEPPPFRFSTKYTDDETGLLHSGYRYYAPDMGRWLSRDPIGEEGETNLYGMVGNDPVNRWDYLGLGWKLKIDEGSKFIAHSPGHHGYLVSAMVAFTAKVPHWQPTKVGISPSSNLAPAGKHTSLFVMMVTQNQREWRRRNPPLFHVGRNPSMLHVWKIVIQAETGNVAASNVAAGIQQPWTVSSEGNLNDYGCAVGAQFRYQESGEFFLWGYQGAGGWASRGLVRQKNAGAYKNYLGPDLEQVLLTGGTGTISDDQGGLLKLHGKIRKVCVEK